MKISKKLYIDEGVSHHKWITWKLRKKKQVKDMYLIIYTKDQFLEIISSHKVKNKHNKEILIGLARSKQSAIDLLVRIFDEVYLENPNIQAMKDYFTKDNS